MQWPHLSSYLHRLVEVLRFSKHIGQLLSVFFSRHLWLLSKLFGMQTSHASQWKLVSALPILHILHLSQWYICLIVSLLKRLQMLQKYFPKTCLHSSLEQTLAGGYSSWHFKHLITEIAYLSMVSTVQPGPFGPMYYSLWHSLQG